MDQYDNNWRGIGFIKPYKKNKNKKKKSFTNVGLIIIIYIFCQNVHRLIDMKFVLLTLISKTQYSLSIYYQNNNNNNNKLED